MQAAAIIREPNHIVSINTQVQVPLVLIYLLNPVIRNPGLNYHFT